MKHSPKYDYLLVGAGLFNAIFAYLAAKDGKYGFIYSRKEYKKYDGCR